jgi:small-conductance mechanosensitive channel
MVPNEDFITSRVTNWTYSNNQARVHVQFGVSYDTPDLRLVEQLALKAALSYPGCVQDPEPRCFLREFGDSSVNFTLMFWVDYVKEGRYGARSAVLFALWDLLKEHHIEIPIPKRDVHLRSVPESLKKD